MRRLVTKRPIEIAEKVLFEQGFSSVAVPDFY